MTHANDPNSPNPHESNDMGEHIDEQVDDRGGEPGDDDVEISLAGQLESMRGELEQARAEILRERADLENQRRRMGRDQEQLRKFANERLLADLLPVFDSLDAGLVAAGEASSPLRDGLELTARQLLKVANDNGLRILEPTGEVFNPDFHQAISQVESADVAPGSVVQVFQKGYVLNERLLRPALVVVARQD